MELSLRGGVEPALVTRTVCARVWSLGASGDGDMITTIVVKSSKRQEAGRQRQQVPILNDLLERTVTMAIASNSTNVADEGPDISNFDLEPAFTTDFAIRRASPRIYEECVGPLSTPKLVDHSRAFQTPAFKGLVSGGQEDTNTVPMQLLKLAKQEENDLLLIYPKAEVQANRILSEHYIFVVKRLLFWYTMVAKNSVADLVPHSQAFARLLRRLSRELRPAPPRGFQFAYCSDPCDYPECLDEMLRDIAETRERLGEAREGPDPERVYVGRSIDVYVRCLIAAAAELHAS